MTFFFFLLLICFEKKKKYKINKLYICIYIFRALEQLQSWVVMDVYQLEIGICFTALCSLFFFFFFFKRFIFALIIVLKQSSSCVCLLKKD